MELTPLQERLRNHSALSKRIKCDQTGEEFPSIAEACRKMNLRASALSMVLHGKQAHTGGYTFSFIDEQKDLSSLYPSAEEVDKMRKEQERNYDKDLIEFELMGGQYSPVEQEPTFELGDVLVYKNNKAVIYGSHESVADRLGIPKKVLHDWIVSGRPNARGMSVTVIMSEEYKNLILKGALK